MRPRPPPCPIFSRARGREPSRRQPMRAGTAYISASTGAMSRTATARRSSIMPAAPAAGRGSGGGGRASVGLQPDEQGLHGRRPTRLRLYQLSEKVLVGFNSDIEGVAVGVSAANWFAPSPITYAQGVHHQHTFGTVRGRAGFLVTPTLLVFWDRRSRLWRGRSERGLVQPDTEARTQRGRDRLRISRHAHRLDGRRRRGVDVPAEVERQGRISLLRSRHGDHDAVASGLWGEGAILQTLLTKVGSMAMSSAPA